MSTQNNWSPPTQTAGVLWDAAGWERALAASFTHLLHDRSDEIVDPGIDVYQHLIRKMRGGTVVSTTQLSYRMLALSQGLDEAQGFSNHLRSIARDVPYLLDVVNFEAASREVIITGEPVEVTFGCDPIPLLDALRKGIRPPDLPAQPHALIVQP